jgi:hypothetical protein
MLPNCETHRASKTTSKRGETGERLTADIAAKQIATKQSVASRDRQALEKLAESTARAQIGRNNATGD